MNSTNFSNLFTTEEPVRLYKGPFWVPIDLTIGVIQCIVCCICLTYCCYTICVSKQNGKSIPKTFVILTISCLISFLMTAITFTINGYYYNTIWWEHTPNTWNTWSLGWLFWACGQCISYILFINRLQLVFHQSVYKLSPCNKIYLYVLIFIYITLWIGITCIPLYLLNADPSSQQIEAKQFWDVQLYFSFVMSSADALITGSMIYMFVSRLYKLLLQNATSDMDELATNPNQVIKFSFQQMSMINVSVKVGVLSMTSLLSSVVTVLLRGLSYFYGKNASYQDVVYAIFNNSQVIWLQIDTIISSVCIVLFLPQTTRGYELFCCCCHRVMSKYYKKSIRQTSIAIRSRTGRRTVSALYTSTAITPSMIRIPSIVTSPNSPSTVITPITPSIHK